MPDAASIAAARVLSRRIGRSCGGSTGTNMWAAARIVGEMAARGEQGAVARLLCDSGERYRGTLLDDAWLAHRGIDIRPARDRMERFFDSGALDRSVWSTRLQRPGSPHMRHPHYTTRMAAVTSMRVVGCGTRGRSL